MVRKETKKGHKAKPNLFKRGSNKKFSNVDRNQIKKFTIRVLKESVQNLSKKPLVLNEGIKNLIENNDLSQIIENESEIDKSGRMSSLSY